MKKYIYSLFSLLLLFSCSGTLSDARIEAYYKAAGSVEKAAASAELVSIAYALKNRIDSLERVLVPVAELQRMAADGDDDSRELLDSIAAAKRRYTDALSRKEMTFYIEKTGKKSKKR